MKNKITYTSRIEAEKIKQKSVMDTETFLVEIDGKQSRCLSDYMTEISVKLIFPTMAHGYAVYDDWMCDLTWINQPNIVIIIYDFGEFLCDDLEAKRTILELFEKSILPWWEFDVCKYVVEGKGRSFTVHLIE